MMKIKLIALMKKNKSDINSLKYICGSIMKIYIKIISSHLINCRDENL